MNVNDVMLRNLTPGIIFPECKGKRIYMRIPQISDYDQWAELRNESRNFLEPWEPKWSSSSLTRIDFRRRLRRYSREVREDKGLALFIFNIRDDKLLGGISLSNLRRGVTQSCSLGYWMGEKYSRNGYMTEAVSLIIDYVFEVLNLHRLEAACVPENIRSLGVLKKTGFTQEGYARKYIKINGSWKDHILFAILSTDEKKKLY